MSGLSPGWGSADSSRRIPRWGARFGNGTKGRESDMKTLRRIAIALGAVLAVAMAGGAHWKVG
jgi:hypothetical protein